MQDDSTQATSWGQHPSSPQAGQPPPPQQPSQQWGQQLPPQQQAPQWSQQQTSQQQSPQWGQQGQVPQPPWGQPPPQQQSEPPVQTQPSQWAQQPPRSSRRLLWIILAIVGVVVILGIIGVVFLSLSSSRSRTSSSGSITSSSPPATVVPTTGAESIATQYYQAIQQQDYQKAYSFLNLSIQGQNVPLTQQLYTQLATNTDARQGKVRNFAVKTVNPSNGSTTITMTVTRNGNPYDVHLTLQQSGADWKIVVFDQI